MDARWQRLQWISRLLAVLSILHASRPEAGFAQTPQTNGKPLAVLSQREAVVPHPGRRVEESAPFLKSLSKVDSSFEVIAGQGRLLTVAEDLSVPERPSPLVAVGDPTIIDFEIVGTRHIRVTGLRIGATDLSIITADQKSHSYEVQVVPDLAYLEARLQATFPDASVSLASLRQHTIVKGEARDTRQVAQIVQMVEAYLESIQPARATVGGAAAQTPVLPPAGERMSPQEQQLTEEQSPYRAPLQFEVQPDRARTALRLATGQSQVINLLRVPGPQQVLLKVQVAELNRTAMRQLGTSFLLQNQNNAVGSAIGPAFPPVDVDAGGGLLGLLNPAAGPTSTAFGVLDSGNVNVLINALRRNQVLTVLAEPNLVALHGQEATFLSGGEFPVPVPQPGTAGLVTIQYRSFGVGLTFVPYILDNETIRLSVAPEVSSINFATGVTIQGTSVPGLNTRRTSTVVQLSEGQTLAISGILQVEMEGGTSRIPGLGDLPYIGPMFSNNSTQSVEKELVVLVTPYLVEPMSAEQVPTLPGQDVLPPDDHEFYFKGRIERRSDRPYRATAAWDDPLGLERRRRLEDRCMCGPHGYSE